MFIHMLTHTHINILRKKNKLLKQVGKVTQGCFFPTPGLVSTQPQSSRWEASTMSVTGASEASGRYYGGHCQTGRPWVVKCLMDFLEMYEQLASMSAVSGAQ